MPSKEELQMLQALPLEIKVMKTQQRIREWVQYYGENSVAVSFSGGKDSTVLLHLVRKLYPDIEAVFINTGLEYPEIQQFVKTFDNVTILRPKMRFDEVIRKYGYPVISKEVSQAIREVKRSIQLGNTDTVRYRQLFSENKIQFNKAKYRPLLKADYNVSDKCCAVMKKKPANDYEKRTGRKPFLATMAEESALRQSNWIIHGCNAFDTKVPKSAPMSFWTEQDVLQYIKQNGIPIASVYGDIVYKDESGFEYNNSLTDDGKLYTTGCNRTGCIFCAFGCHLEKEPSRFQRLKETHPRQYEYCIGGGAYDDDGIWKPNKQGLGMGHVFDELNKLYGDGFIKY